MWVKVVVTSTVIALASCSSEVTPRAEDTGRVVEVVVGRATVYLKPQAITVGTNAEVDLASLTEETLVLIDRSLDLPAVEIYVEADAERAIPEVGVGGKTDVTSGGVIIGIDPTFDDLNDELTVWYPRILAHELHHAKRIVDGPGYGRNLGEQVVTEGLADVFSLEIVPDGPELPWTVALSTQEFAQKRERFIRQSESRMTTDRHLEWFFGEGDLPRWTGYSLGFSIVERHIDLTGKTAAELATAPAQKILGNF